MRRGRGAAAAGGGGRSEADVDGGGDRVAGEAGDDEGVAARVDVGGMGGVVGLERDAVVE